MSRCWAWWPLRRTGCCTGGAAGAGAYRRHLDAAPRAIHVCPPENPIRVVGSRSHTSAETARYLERLGPHVVSGVGSALKFCLLAEGKADLYSRFGPTSEWDTAAGQALLEAAGGQVTRLDGHRLRYNCRESLINGDFIAFGDASVLPPLGASEPSACLTLGALGVSSRGAAAQAWPTASHNSSVASSSVGISNTTSSSAIFSRATPAAAINAAGTCS